MNQPFSLMPTSTNIRIRYIGDDARQHLPFFQVFDRLHRWIERNTWMVWRGSRPGLSSSSIISNKVGIPDFVRDVFLQVELFLQFFIADQFGDSTFQVLCHQFDDRITFRMDGRVVQWFLPSWIRRKPALCSKAFSPMRGTFRSSRRDWKGPCSVR